MHEILTEAPQRICSVAGVYPVGSCRGLFRAEVWHQDQPGVQRKRSKGILTVDDLIELLADELDLLAKIAGRGQELEEKRRE